MNRIRQSKLTNIATRDWRDGGAEPLLDEGEAPPPAGRIDDPSRAKGPAIDRDALKATDVPVGMPTCLKEW